MAKIKLRLPNDNFYYEYNTKSESFRIRHQIELNITDDLSTYFNSLGISIANIVTLDETVFDYYTDISPKSKSLDDVDNILTVINGNKFIRQYDLRKIKDINKNIKDIKIRKYGALLTYGYVDLDNLDKTNYSLRYASIDVENNVLETSDSFSSYDSPAHIDDILKGYHILNFYNRKKYHIIPSEYIAKKLIPHPKLMDKMFNTPWSTTGSVPLNEISIKLLKVCAILIEEKYI